MGKIRARSLARSGYEGGQDQGKRKADKISLRRILARSGYKDGGQD